MLPSLMVERAIVGVLTDEEYTRVKAAIEAEYPPQEWREWSPVSCKQCNEILETAEKLRMLCTLLTRKENKLWVASNQYQPRVRQRTHLVTHPQRSYQDMLNEVAAELTNLPVFTAQVRITTEVGLVEHTIKTLDPKQQPERPLFGQALQERLARIKDQNIQDGYLRERTTVEAEIRTRQEQCSRREDEPPISRWEQS